MAKKTEYDKSAGARFRAALSHFKDYFKPETTPEGARYWERLFLRMELHGKAADGNEKAAERLSNMAAEDLLEDAALTPLERTQRRVAQFKERVHGSRS